MANELSRLKKLQKMRDSTQDHLEQTKACIVENGNTIDTHLGMVQAEYHRVTELSGQAGLIINQIDKDFKEKTKLRTLYCFFHV